MAEPSTLVAKARDLERLCRTYLLLGRRNPQDPKTQEELGRAIGLSQSGMSRLLNGKQQLSLAEFIALSWAVGVDPAAILRLMDSTPPEKP